MAGCSSGNAEELVNEINPLEVYQPAYADGVNMNDDQARSEDELVGFMGFRDGTVKPVKFRMNDDATVGYLAVDGGDEMIFDTQVLTEGGYAFENAETEHICRHFFRL